MPKTLFPVGAKPILHHIIDKITDEGGIKTFSKIIFLTGSFSEMIKYYIDILKPKIPIKYRPVAKTPHLTLRQLKIKTAFMVHYSDIVLEGTVNWRKFIGYHKFMRKTEGVIGTLMVSSKYYLPVGRVVVDDKDIIQRFKEKPFRTFGHYINMAVSIFEPEFLAYIKNDDDRLYGDCVANAMKAGKKFAIFKHSDWKHIQKLSDWYEAQKEKFPNDVP